MILTAHQPCYLPWLGLFHKIAMATDFCIFDIVQYQTKDFNSRNLIKTNSGSIWLSVPVESKNHLEKKFNDIKILNNGWNKKHYKSIFLAYKKSPYFDLYIDKIENILIRNNYIYLVDLNIDFLVLLLSELNIKVNLHRASEHNFTGAKSDLVLSMCQNLGAKSYIFGSQGLNYANKESFESNGIKLHFQNYSHPSYSQLHGDFIPNMSVIDLLFNEGPNAMAVLMRGNEIFN